MKVKVRVVSDKLWCEKGDMYVVDNMRRIGISFGVETRITEEEPHKIILCHPDDREKLVAGLAADKDFVVVEKKVGAGG